MLRPREPMSDPTDDERTDPSVALPPEPRADRAEIRQTTLRSGGELPPPLPRASAPPPLPPLPPSRLPPPPAAARPLARPASIPPPGGMPRPSDPPAARTEPSARDRQRVAQLEMQLDQAKATIARQKSELDELRARLAAVDARFEELDRRLSTDTRAELLEQRIEELEARGDEAARELARRLDEATQVSLAPRLDALTERLRALEEGSAEARIRMRLERAGHRIDEVEQRVAALEEAQRAGAAEARRGAELEARLARLESLFEELAEDVKSERDAHDLDGLRARLDDIEALVARTGTEEQTLKRKLGEQERALLMLRESMAPPAMPAQTTDDLTRIKGIGPKYARMLGEMGVTRYAQIAAWSEEELEHVAEQLGIPAARIKKAGWIENAARLAAG